MYQGKGTRIPAYILSIATLLAGCNKTSQILTESSQQKSSSDRYPRRLAITTGGKRGYIDETGRVVINPQWELAYEFSEGLAAVCVGQCSLSETSDDAGKHPADKYGFINSAGRFIINPRYDSASSFKEGLAAVCLGRGCVTRFPIVQNEAKWGFVDRAGAEKIPPQFDSVGQFSEGLACVSIGGKYGYIDEAGKFVINPQFDFAGEFDDGLAEVSMKSGTDPFAYEYGYIDRSGKYIWTPTK